MRPSCLNEWWQQVRSDDSLLGEPIKQVHNQSLPVFICPAVKVSNLSKMVAFDASRLATRSFKSTFSFFRALTSSAVCSKKTHSNGSPSKTKLQVSSSTSGKQIHQHALAPHLRETLLQSHRQLHKKSCCSCLRDWGLFVWWLVGLVWWLLELFV